jgi:hypothetical protein
MPLALKVGCPSSGAGCDIAFGLLVCWSDGNVLWGYVFLRFPSIGVYFVVSQSWCGVSRLLVEFLRVQVLLCVVSFRGCAETRDRAPPSKSQ